MGTEGVVATTQGFLASMHLPLRTVSLSCWLLRRLKPKIRQDLPIIQIPLLSLTVMWCRPLDPLHFMQVNLLGCKGGLSFPTHGATRPWQLHRRKNGLLVIKVLIAKEIHAHIFLLATLAEVSSHHRLCKRPKAALGVGEKRCEILMTFETSY